MTIKQSFKFLNTLGFSSKNMPVFSIGQCYEVDDSVIASYSVKVMHYPALRQRLLISFFPYKDMLKDITPAIGSGMFRQKYLDIASDFTPTTFVNSIAYPSFSRANGNLICTGFAMLRPIINEFTTRTMFPVSKTAFFALLQLLFTMRMIILSVIFFTIHRLIVTQNTIYCKEVA